MVIRSTFPYLFIIGLAVFFPIEEFIEKWLPRGSIYEAVRFGSEFILIALLIWVFVTKSFIPGKWKKTPIDLPLFLLLFFSMVSTLFNDLPISLYLLGLRPILRFITVFYIIVQLGYNRIFSERFAKVCLIIASSVSLIAILQSIIGLPASYFLLPEDVEVGGEFVREGARQFIATRTRVFSTLGRYDTLGTFLSVMILLVTSLYWTKAIPKRYYYWFLMFSIPALILSYSRQSWLVILVGVLILMILHKKYQHLFIFGIISASVVFIILIFLSGYIYYSSNQVNVPLLNRILEPFSQRYLEISRYNYGRLFVIVEVSRRILEKAPLLGFGPGNFGSLTARFFGRDFSSLINLNPESAHLINDVNWVTVLGQLGLIGTLLLGVILILMIVSSRKIFKYTKDPLLRGYASSLVAILVGFMIMGFFGPNFEVRQVSFFVWAIAGIVFSIQISKIASQTSEHRHKSNPDLLISSTQD